MFVFLFVFNLKKPQTQMYPAVFCFYVVVCFVVLLFVVVVVFLFVLCSVLLLFTGDGVL